MHAQWRTGTTPRGTTQCAWTPSRLAAYPSGCTHLLYAFAFLEDASKGFAPLIEDNAQAVGVLLPQMRALRQANPSLKLMLAIGGW